jgi:hypothetical protein
MAGLGPVTGDPSISMRPLVGRSNPARHLSRVVFPHPEGPTTHTSSPRLMVKLRSPIASTSPVVVA